MNREVNEDYLKNLNVSLVPINRYLSVSNWDLDLVKTVQNIECSVQLFTCYIQCRPFLVNITFNLCEFNGKSKHFYVNMLYRSVPKNSTNLLRSCPVPPVNIFFGFSLTLLLFFIILGPLLHT